MVDSGGEPDELTDALSSVQFSPTKPSTSRQTPIHPAASGSQAQRHANGRSRTPSLSSRRRNSFDERRIPPSVNEDSASSDNLDTAPPVAQTASGSRSRSGTASSHRLLRRMSSDTMQSQDFDSDPEIFVPRRPLSIASTGTRRSSLVGGIHIRDNSDQEITSFAREVRIPTFHTVGNTFGGFVAYECQIFTREGATVTTMKRYSAFCQLRDELADAHPRFSHLLDTLPPKSLAKFRVSFLEKRRKRLAFWLSTVLLHPVLGGSQQAKAWILE